MSKELKRRSPVKAIRQYCIECTGDSMAEAKRCELKDCPLWRYRMGRTGRTVAPEVAAAGAARLAAARELRKAK